MLLPRDCSWDVGHASCAKTASNAFPPSRTLQAPGGLGCADSPRSPSLPRSVVVFPSQEIIAVYTYLAGSERLLNGLSTRGWPQCGRSHAHVRSFSLFLCLFLSFFLSFLLKDLFVLRVGQREKRLSSTLP